MLRRRWVVLAIPMVLLFLAARPIAAAPTLAIEPGSGPLGTSFVALLAGFTPGETVSLRLTAETSPPRTLDVPAITIGADGRYRLEISSPLLQPGTYTLAALRQGSVVASAGFTVTEGDPATPPPGRPTAAPPVPTATRGPAATATTLPPAPPPTGNGGNLPGLPNTGEGPPPPTFPTHSALAALVALLGAALIGGRILHRAGRRAARGSEEGER